jgi:hypothetical protein
MHSTNRARELLKLQKYSTAVSAKKIVCSILSTGRIGERAMSYLIDLFPRDARGFTKAVPLIKQIGIILARYNVRAGLYMSKRHLDARSDSATVGDG